MDDHIDHNLKSYQGKSMTASEYYYGCSSDTWDQMFYSEAIKDRRDRSWALFCELFMERSKLPLTEMPLPEKELRMRKVQGAFEDNKQLCDEKSLIL